ncbi:MAG: THUMP domain-containing protein, partial [Candidatus Aenigmatarchaeota archaeon]
MNKKFIKINMKFILTCDPGLEDVVKLELKEKIKNAKFLGKFKNLPGKVLIETKSLKKLFSFRSIHHVMKFISQFQIESSEKIGLEEIASKLDEINLARFLKNKKSFRIST